MYDVISLVDASLPGMFPARPYATRVETTNRIPLAGAQRSHMPLSMCPSYEEWREHLPPAPGPKSSAVCSRLRARRVAVAQWDATERARLIGLLTDAGPTVLV